MERVVVAVFRTGRDQAGELGYLPWEIALATQAENMVECRHQAGVMDPENHSLKAVLRATGCHMDRESVG